MKPEQIDYNAKLDDAANAISVDDRELVRACLESVFDETSDRADVWLLKAWVCESLEGAANALQQALALEPHNEVAKAGQKWILGIQGFADHQREKQRLFKEVEQARAAEEARLAAQREAARIKEEEERARAAEEARLKEEAERKHAAEKARLEAEREAARIKKEEERARAAEQARLEAEREAERIKEEERIQAEEAEQARAAEEARLAEERAAQTKAEEEQARALEAERLRAAEESRLMAEEQAIIQEQIACQQAKMESSADPVESDADSCEAIEHEIKEMVDTFATEVRHQVEMTETELTEVEMTETDMSLPHENEDASIKPVILAVDDSPTIRKLISLTLTQHGFEVITAEDGIQALSIIAERLPDLILSDINMPKLGGYQLCKFVKKHERTKDIPVIMLSGKDGVFDKMRGKLSGCNAFIGKPFESKELVEIVRANLNAVNS